MCALFVDFYTAVGLFVGSGRGGARVWTHRYSLLAESKSSLNCRLVKENINVRCSTQKCIATNAQ